MNLEQEYNELLRCIGYLVNIAVDTTIYSGRLITLTKTDDGQIILYLSKNLGIAAINKDNTEFLQYLVHVRGRVINEHFRTDNIKIDHKKDGEIWLILR